MDGTLELISQPSDVPDPDTDGAFFAGASADGGRVFFHTRQELSAGDTDTDRLDVYERAGGVTTLVSQPTGVADPETGDVVLAGASADGSRVLVLTEQRLTADDGDSGLIDVYERAGGMTTLLSQPTGVADPNSDHVLFEGASADGSRVFLHTFQKLSPDDTDPDRLDVYERAGGVTRLLSQPTGVSDPGTDNVLFAGASADGSRVFFQTSQQLTADDTDSGFEDVYERAGGVTTLVSQPSGVADSDGVSFVGSSADGSRVFFVTRQKLTADDTDTDRNDVYERAGGVTTLVSQPSGVADPDTGDVFFEGASADGGRVFFRTSQQLTADDTDSGFEDVYERAGGVTTLLSKPSGVADPDTGDAFFEGASADGSRVFFRTSQQLSADDTDSGFEDVYERAGGVTTLVSRPTGVPDPDTDHAFFEGASDGGNRVFFQSSERLIADDNDSDRADVYAAGSPDPPPPAPSGPPGSSGAPAAGLVSPLAGLLPGACANQKLGGAGADLLDGTSAGDTLRGLAGNDRLNGLAERDCLFGDAGNDRLSGGADNDRLTGSAGQDRGSGGPGNDRFAGGAQTDTAAGGAGNDRLAGGRGRDRLLGGGGRDRINPGGGRDRIATGPGNDRVSARGNGADTIDCGRGRRDLAIVDRLDSTRNCERVRPR